MFHPPHNYRSLCLAFLVFPLIVIVACRSVENPPPSRQGEGFLSSPDLSATLQTKEELRVAVWAKITSERDSAKVRLHRHLATTDTMPIDTDTWQTMSIQGFRLKIPFAEYKNVGVNNNSERLSNATALVVCNIKHGNTLFFVAVHLGGRELLTNNALQRAIDDIRGMKMGEELSQSFEKAAKNILNKTAEQIFVETMRVDHAAVLQESNTNMEQLIMAVAGEKTSRGMADSRPYNTLYRVKCGENTAYISIMNTMDDIVDRGFFQVAVSVYGNDGKYFGYMESDSNRLPQLMGIAASIKYVWKTTPANRD